MNTPPIPPDRDSALTRRILDAAQALDREIAVPDLAVVRQELAERLATPAGAHRPTRHERIEMGRTEPAKRRFAVASVARIALGACVLAALVLGIQRFSRSGDLERVAHYATAAGQRARIVLPDGSRIMLAPDSRLSYTVDSHGARVATLTGHAYFTVMHDARRPFTVRTGTVHTQVLGTAFDVQHYADDSIVRILVVDGKVASRGHGGTGTPVLLVAGTEGQLTDSTALVVTNRKTNDANAWTRGQLVFDDTPVPEMLRTLQHWYGYEFHLADSSLAKQRVTAGFTIGDTVNTMAGLKMLLDVTLRFDGSIVTLSPVHKSRTVVPPVQRGHPVFPSQSEVGK